MLQEEKRRESPGRLVSARPLNVTIITNMTSITKGDGPEAGRAPARSPQPVSGKLGSADPIDIRLDRPFAVGATPCSRLTVWLLAITSLRRAGGARQVGLAELTTQLRSPQALPMAVSRVFAALGRAGIRLGWGDDVSLDPDTLPLHGRARGPFWLPPGEAGRLRFLLRSAPATAAELRRFVGLAGLAGPAGGGAGGGSLHDLDRWYELLDVRQRAEEGTAAPGDAMAVRRLALAAAGPELSSAWAHLISARQARRAGDIAAARASLTALVRRVPHGHSPRHLAAHTLARIGLAWCDHQDRRLGAAMRRLQQLTQEIRTADGAAWLHNPRVACEFFNLRALVARARLLEKPPAAGASPQVGEVFDDLRQALICAVETDAFTLLESVAANLGYTLWLLEPWLPPGLAGRGGRLEAVGWVLLSEWLCQRHGLAAGSPWNLINICRVARGAGRTVGPGAAAGFSLAELRSAVGPMASVLGVAQTVRDWIDLSATLADAAQRPGSGHSPLQRCAAHVEHLWRLAAAGRWKDARRQQAAIEALLPGLAGSDRKFFRAELLAVGLPG